ncbi:hypothetical protein [Polyangium sp. 15x6]|uniref:hypothetical protein n=1 Tax=Polyangium sp. 15x6 TaxID=3042687 RepID=UPI00249C2356|nr:hypothetical protein [Polyangium sp. 15x6]MDI3284110.1 hypothetical protein [Polyangium sp. 15x6]
MKTTSIAVGSSPRALALVTSALLLGALTGGCVVGSEVGSEEETLGEAQEALTAYSFFTESSTTNFSGTTIPASVALQSCFLSGVAGNLNRGDRFGGIASLQSAAAVRATSTTYTLFGHGGAYTNQVNDPVAINNLVKATATCFPIAPNVSGGGWDSDDPPVWINHPGTSLRQCFLTSLVGVDGAWNSGSNFARVVKVTTTDATHPIPGWYIEGNLPDAVNSSDAHISADCLDFPEGTEFASGMVYSTEDGSTTVPIGLGLGTTVRIGCALTEVQGAFNVNDATEGVLMSPPSGWGAGSWSITVKGARIAKWVCAK